MSSQVADLIILCPCITNLLLLVESILVVTWSRHKMYDMWNVPTHLLCGIVEVCYFMLPYIIMTQTWLMYYITKLMYNIMMSDWPMMKETSMNEKNNINLISLMVLGTCDDQYHLSIKTPVPLLWPKQWNKRSSMHMQWIIFSCQSICQNTLLCSWPYITTPMHCLLNSNLGSVIELKVYCLH